MPRPNQSRKIGARTTRGTAFSIVMYGSQMRAASRQRPNTKPSPIPIAAPITSPRTASSSVVARWPQMAPVRVHAAIRTAMALGRLTKNGSRSFARTPDSQAATTRMAMAICQRRTVVRRGSVTRHVRARLASDDFLSQIRPDRSVQLDEARLRPEIEQIARPTERNAMARHDTACRPGREDDHFVGERDGFLEIVRHEDDGFSCRRLPEREQLGFHPM